MVRLPDGRFAVGESYRSDGRSMLYYDFADHLNTTAFPQSNETTVGIHLDEETLNGIEYVDIIVTGRYVTPGNLPGTLGIEGDRLGFGLAVRGVELDPLNHSDADGDGVPYEGDVCPFVSALGWDLDMDGCIDDLDEDGVEDNFDDCLMTPLDVPVTQQGCAQQNEAPRVFLDEVSLQQHDNETMSILFSILDEDPVNVTIVLERLGSQTGTVYVCTMLVLDDAWNMCSVNVSQDFFPLSAAGNWTVVFDATDLNSSSWTAPASTSYMSEQITIHVSQPIQEEKNRASSWPNAALWSSLVAAIVISLIAQFVLRKSRHV